MDNNIRFGVPDWQNPICRTMDMKSSRRNGIILPVDNLMNGPLKKYMVNIAKYLG